MKNKDDDIQVSRVAQWLSFLVCGAAAGSRVRGYRTECRESESRENTEDTAAKTGQCGSSASIVFYFITNQFYSFPLVVTTVKSEYHGSRRDDGDRGGCPDTHHRSGFTEKVGKVVVEMIDH